MRQIHARRKLVFNLMPVVCIQGFYDRKGIDMASICKPLLLAAVLASTGLAAQAQSSGAGEPGAMHHMARMDPAKMQEMMAKRQAELKEQLKLSAAQEAAWATYANATQPPAAMAARMDPGQRKKMHDDMQKLTTPERIDRMNAMKAQRDAEMSRRGEATKVFYAALTAEQQKVFDNFSMRGRAHHGLAPGMRHRNG